MTNKPDLRGMNEADFATLTIVVPGLPPAECSKNARVHFMVAARAASWFKHDVYYATKEVLPPDWQAERVRVCLVIQRPYIRRSDPDGWWTRFKSGLDALVLAGVVVDDDSEHLELGSIGYAKGQPETRIIVERLR